MTDHAVARNTDPETSHQAAASVTHIRESQARIMLILKLVGPLTDGGIFKNWPTWAGPISPSGCRTRRKELVDLGYVRDSGKRMILASGRKSIIWEAVPVNELPISQSKMFG